jgi:hypothetical protein
VSDGRLGLGDGSGYERFEFKRFGVVIHEAPGEYLGDLLGAQPEGFRTRRPLSEDTPNGDIVADHPEASPANLHRGRIGVQHEAGRRRESQQLLQSLIFACVLP